MNDETIPWIIIHILPLPLYLQAHNITAAITWPTT